MHNQNSTFVRCPLTRVRVSDSYQAAMTYVDLLIEVCDGMWNVAFLNGDYVEARRINTVSETLFRIRETLAREVVA